MADDTGPTVTTPRWKVYDRLRTIAALAQNGMELTIKDGGNSTDVPRALGMLDRINALSSMGGGDV
jgi:hypothetical protein